MNQTDQIRVMNEWKKIYIHALVDAIRPFGDVLEIGFDGGFAAERIQKYHPKKHVIMENDSKIAAEAKSWAAGHAGITVLQDTWYNPISKLGQFDAIFLYDYENEIVLMQNLCPAVVDLASKQTREILDTLEKQLAQLSVRYSDQDIDEFYRNLGQYHPEEVPKFFQKLRDNHFITEEQYRNAFQKYQMGKKVSKRSRLLDVNKQPDRLALFLESCLKNYMRKGSRFSCFLSDFTSKHEDALFVEKIITNPDFKYEEKMVPIRISNELGYNLPIEALMIVIEKLV